MTDTEHPFAPYIRILGKGKNGSRSLTLDEARESMQMILNDAVDPMQLGAFLMLIRVKEESAEEVAGFVQANRDTTGKLALPPVDLDWSSYAGKRRQLPWYMLSAFLLAGHGIRVLMQGSSPHTPGRIYSEDVLPHFGLSRAHSIAAAANDLQQHNFAYLPLDVFAPRLQQIIDYKPILGLRSPVHTVARMLNPGNAAHSMQGIFHPGYQRIHQQASLLLGDKHSCVFKGEGGEAELNPDADCEIYAVNQGVDSITHWPAMFSKRHVKNESMDVSQLKQVWQGSRADEYGEAAIIGTCAIALITLQREKTADAALALARQLWQSRDKTRFD
ncbi:MAG: glycosyl transferase family protein [Gammaproteobacteria bacterium]|nr:glycosyl transferase family protein [Gammaproteobacteria bacterium]